MAVGAELRSSTSGKPLRPAPPALRNEPGGLKQAGEPRYAQVAPPQTRVSPSAQEVDGVHDAVLTAQFAPLAQCTLHDFAPEQSTLQSPAHLTSHVVALLHATLDPAPTESEQLVAPLQSTLAAEPVDPAQLAPREQFTLDSAPTSRLHVPW